MKKRNIIIPALLTTIVSSSLIAGATYAIFTSEDTKNITVNSGEVDVSSEITNIKLFSMGKEMPGLYFENGGKALLNKDGSFSISNITPGDKITFDIQIKNLSSVKVQYRFNFALLSGSQLLFDNLNKILPSKTSWNKIHETLDPSSPTTVTKSVSIELESTKGNDFKNLDLTFKVLVEAIQDNAINEDGESLMEVADARLLAIQEIDKYEGYYTNEETLANSKEAKNLIKEAKTIKEINLAKNNYISFNRTKFSNYIDGIYNPYKTSVETFLAEENKTTLTENEINASIEAFANELVKIQTKTDFDTKFAAFKTEVDELILKEKTLTTEKEALNTSLDEYVKTKFDTTEARSYATTQKTKILAADNSKIANELFNTGKAYIDSLFTSYVDGLKDTALTYKTNKYDNTNATSYKESISSAYDKFLVDIANVKNLNEADAAYETFKSSVDLAFSSDTTLTENKNTALEPLETKITSYGFDDLIAEFEALKLEAVTSSDLDDIKSKIDVLSKKADDKLVEYRNEYLTLATEYANASLTTTSSVGDAKINEVLTSFTNTFSSLTSKSSIDKTYNEFKAQIDDLVTEDNELKIAKNNAIEEIESKNTNYFVEDIQADVTSYTNKIESATDIATVDSEKEACLTLIEMSFHEYKVTKLALLDEEITLAKDNLYFDSNVQTLDGNITSLRESLNSDFITSTDFNSTYESIVSNINTIVNKDKQDKIALDANKEETKGNLEQHRFDIYGDRNNLKEYVGSQNESIDLAMSIKAVDDIYEAAIYQIDSTFVTDKNNIKKEATNYRSTEIASLSIDKQQIRTTKLDEFIANIDSVSTTTYDQVETYLNQYKLAMDNLALGDARKDAKDAIAKHDASIFKVTKDLKRENTIRDFNLRIDSANSVTEINNIKTEAIKSIDDMFDKYKKSKSMSGSENAVKMNLEMTNIKFIASEEENLITAVRNKEISYNALIIKANTDQEVIGYCDSFKSDVKALYLDTIRVNRKRVLTDYSKSTLTNNELDIQSYLDNIDNATSSEEIISAYEAGVSAVDGTLNTVKNQVQGNLTIEYNRYMKDPRFTGKATQITRVYDRFVSDITEAKTTGRARSAGDINLFRQQVDALL